MHIFLCLSVILKAWNQEIKIKYTNWYSWFSATVKKPHSIVIGRESFKGSVSQFAIEDR